MVEQSERQTLNPYARFLGAREPRTVIAETPSALATCIRGLAEAHLTRSPAPGKWSIRDILCHLADCEIVFGFRLRQTVAETDHRIQPFDQNAWAAPFPKLAASEALAAFSAIRRWNLLFIDAVVPSALPRRVTHPERGTMTFQTILETMGGHDLNHVAQIEAIAAQR